MMTNEEQMEREIHTMQWRIPAAIFFGLLLQAAGAVWWASGVEARLSQIDKTNISYNTRIDLIDAARSSASERIARVEQSSSDILKWLERIDSKLDRIAPQH